MVMPSTPRAIRLGQGLGVGDGPGGDVQAGGVESATPSGVRPAMPQRAQPASASRVSVSTSATGGVRPKIRPVAAAGNAWRTASRISGWNDVTSVRSASAGSAFSDCASSGTAACRLDLGLEADVDRGDRLRPGRDHLAESGVERPELVVRQRGDLAGPRRGPVDGRVVHDHELAVGGDAEVQLDLVAAVGDRAPERAQRVLRFGPECTPVAGDDHSTFSS